MRFRRWALPLRHGGRCALLQPRPRMAKVRVRSQQNWRPRKRVDAARSFRLYRIHADADPALLMFCSIACSPTAIGECGIAWSGRGVARLALPEGDRAATERRLQVAHRRRRTQRSAGVDQRPSRKSNAMRGASAEDFLSIDIDLRVSTPFRRDVYAATRDVGWGETASYGEIARRIGTADAREGWAGAVAQSGASRRSVSSRRGKRRQACRVLGLRWYIDERAAARAGRFWGRRAAPAGAVRSGAQLRAARSAALKHGANSVSPRSSRRPPTLRFGALQDEVPTLRIAGLNPGYVASTVSIPWENE